MNRLQSYVRSNGGTTEASFLYAFMVTGQRLSKQDVQAAKTEWSASDGDDVVEDLQQSRRRAKRRRAEHVRLSAL